MRTVFWNVDTQHDFMDEDGALYVPNAELIKPNLRQITMYANSHLIRVMGSVDAHTESDPEMKPNGGPFPYHCMKGTYGQRIIPQTAPANPLFVRNEPYAEDDLMEIAGREGEIIFEKQHYDVFTNPNTEKLLDMLGVDRAVVYGVATDYCNRAAALGLRRCGINVYLVEDAIKPVDEKGGLLALGEMHDAGVVPATTSEILRGLFE